MRVRHRLALFWILTVVAFGSAAAAGMLYYFPGAMKIKWLNRLDVNLEVGWTTGALWLLAAGITWAAWRPGGGWLGAWAARVGEGAGPWIFGALLWGAFGAQVLFFLRNSFVFAFCLAGAAAAILYLLPRQQLWAWGKDNGTSAARWLARRGIWFWTLAALALLLGLNWYVHRGEPGMGDAMAQMFQGLILASGHLKWPQWEYPLFFAGHGLNIIGGWYSQYPPGHCVLMAIGWLLHAPGAVMPVLGALSVFLAWDCGRMLYGRRVAAIAAAFYVFNPWWPVMAPHYMNHGSTLFWLALSFDFGLRMARGSSAWTAYGAGFALGWAAATRPLTAAAFGAPGIAALLWRRARGRDPGWSALLAAGLGFATWVVLFLGYNWGTTDHPLVSGYEANAGARMLPGFHKGNRHTLELGFVDTLTNFVFFRYWGAVAEPGFFLPLLWLFLFARMGRREWLLLSQWLLMGAIYAIHYWQDLSIGPRYLYESLLPYSLLAAGSLARAAKRFEHFLSQGAGRGIRLRRTLNWAVAGLCLWSGWGAIPEVRRHAAKYANRREFIETAMKAIHYDPRAVVFVNSFRHELFILGMARDPRGPLFLNHLSDELNRQLMARYPKRKYYYMWGGNIWPYEKAPESVLLDRKEVNWLPLGETSKEMLKYFRVPRGRPLPEPHEPERTE